MQKVYKIAAGLLGAGLMLFAAQQAFAILTLGPLSVDSSAALNLGPTASSVVITPNTTVVGTLSVATTTVGVGGLTVNGTVTLQNSATIDNGNNGTIQVLGGILKSGNTAGVNAVGGRTMVYGYYSATTTALTGTGLGVQGEARLSSTDSSAGTLQGGLFKAGNGTAADTQTGGDLLTMTGVYAAVASSPTPSHATKTVTNARGVEITMDLNQADTAITNAYGVYMSYQTDSAPTITNGYGLWMKNQGVLGGGNGSGQTLNSALYVSDAMGGSVKGWDYGLNLSGVGAGFGTADIKLSRGNTINNSAIGTITFGSASLTTTGTMTAATSTATGVIIVPSHSATLVDKADGTATCGSDNRGAIVIDAANLFYGCDGTNWTKLSN